MWKTEIFPVSKGFFVNRRNENFPQCLNRKFFLFFERKMLTEKLSTFHSICGKLKTGVDIGGNITN